MTRVSRFTTGTAVTAVPITSFPRRRGEDDLLPSAWVVPGYAVRRGMQYRATGGTLWGRHGPPVVTPTIPPSFLKIGPRKNFMFSKFPGYRTSAKGKPPHRFCSVRRFSFTCYSGIRTSTFGLWIITQAAPGPFLSGKQYQPRSGGYTSQTRSLVSAHSMHWSWIIWKVCSGA